jgi:hypothetical protein
MTSILPKGTIGSVASLLAITLYQGNTVHLNSINRQFTSVMENNFSENARWNVNKTIGYLVRNKIKHRKKYKIGKSPTP